MVPVRVSLEVPIPLQGRNQETQIKHDSGSDQNFGLSETLIRRKTKYENAKVSLVSRNWHITCIGVHISIIPL